MVQENIVILLKVFLHKWENFTFSLLLMMKGGLQKLFALQLDW